MNKKWKFYFSLGLVWAFFLLFLFYPIFHLLQGCVLVEFEGKTRFTLIFFKLFSESAFMWRCLGTSLALSGLTTLLCALIGVPLANLFIHYQFPFKSLWQTLLMSSLILPPFVGAIGFQQLFARFGPFNHWIGLVGPGVSFPHPVDWLGSGGWGGVIIAQTLHLFPILFLYVSASLLKIDHSLREAARCLGARPFHVWRTVTLPLCSPGLFAGGVLVFIWAFTDLGTPLIFGLNQVVAVQIFDKVTETGFNPFGYVLVVGVLMVTLLLFLVPRRLLLAQKEFIAPGRLQSWQDLIPLRGFSRWTALGALFFLSALCLLPHVSVLAQSLSNQWFMSPLPRQWSTEHYREIFTLPQTLSGLKNSFLYASLSTLLDILLGVAIAGWLSRREFAGKTLLDSVAMLPLAMPGIVLAFGYVVGFNIPHRWHGLDLDWIRSWVNPRENPMFLLMVSYSLRRLPYLVRAAHAGFQQLDPTLEEASFNLGAGKGTTLRRIVLPLLRTHLIAGAILTFAFVFLEVSDSLILAMQEKYYPVTKTIWALMGRIEPNASSVACALGVVGMAILFAAFFTANRLLGKKMGNLFG